jgi:CheY-like chemotaxis protein
MARVYVLHTKEEEAQPLLRSLETAGHQVQYRARASGDTVRQIRQNPPDALVIDLSRAPSHGMNYAMYFRKTKATRHVPFVFVEGDAEKVEKVKKFFPDSIYTTKAKIATALKRAIRIPQHAIVEGGYMEQWAHRSTAEKLGIKPGARVAVFDAPRDYLRVLGKLPEDVTFEEDPDEVLSLSVWFVRDPDAYAAGLRQRRSLAGRSKLWVAWPKGQRDGITQFVVREVALAVGLVDYKICSVNDAWSAMALALKKA